MVAPLAFNQPVGAASAAKNATKPGSSVAPIASRAAASSVAVNTASPTEVAPSTSRTASTAAGDGSNDAATTLPADGTAIDCAVTNRVKMLSVSTGVTSAKVISKPSSV